MDEDIRKQMQAKWAASQAAQAPAGAAQTPATVPTSPSGADAAEAEPSNVDRQNNADFEAYKRQMAERYAKTAAASQPAASDPAPAPASNTGEPRAAPEPPAPPKSPRTAARELREQQDREYQEALAADTAAAGRQEPLPPQPTETEQELRRRQVAELRARRGEAQTASAGSGVGATPPAPAEEAAPAGMVRDDVTGEMRSAAAQGRVQRLTDDLPGMGGMGVDMGIPGMPLPMGGFPGGLQGPRTPGARPELPQQLRQTLSESQLELLYEAMGEVGGGFPGFGGFPGGPPPGGGMGMPGGPPAGMPMPGFDMGMPRRRAPPPFGGGFDDDEGMPSNWDPRNARQTETEQELRRRQVAELRARARGEAPPAADAGGAESAAAPAAGDGMVQDEITGETRPAAAQGRVQRLTDDGPAGPPRMGPPGGFPWMPGRFPGMPGEGGGGPQTLREMAMNEQAMEGYGRPDMRGGMVGGLPPWARMGREPEGYEELSAISERIGDVSRGVPVATIDQNSFTFQYEPPAPDSEIAVQAANDPTLARCSVCLCDLEKGEECRRLPCLHMFHKGCIDDWLKRNRCCPVCKTDICTGAQETRREGGQEQCSAAAMPGEPDFQPPGWGEEGIGAAAGIPGGYGLGLARQRQQPGVGFGSAQGPAATAAAAGASPARGYFDRARPFGGDGPPPGVFGGFEDAPPPGIFGGGFGDGPPQPFFLPGYARRGDAPGQQHMPMPSGPPSGMFGAGAANSSNAQAAAAHAAEARAAAAAAAGDETGSGMVQDSVTGEMRPVAAQGRVQRLDGGDEGDLWRGMEGMGISGGYQAQGRGPYFGADANPYYDQMLRSRGPLGAMRPGRNPGGLAAAQSGYGRASNAATMSDLGGGGGGVHPAMRGMGPMGMSGRPDQGQGAGPGGSMAEQLLMQARMQQRMAMEAMGQGAMSEPRPQQGAGGGGNREWNHFFQGR